MVDENSINWIISKPFFCLAFQHVLNFERFSFASNLFVCFNYSSLSNFGGPLLKGLFWRRRIFGCFGQWPLLEAYLVHFSGSFADFITHLTMFDSS
jgi:hypothetical protein